MTAFDINWRKLVTLVSQQQDIIKYKETVYESFNLYPTSRPALLDLFSDIIVDKYIHSYIHQRNNYTNELEEVISLLMKEINSILDKEFECPDYVNTALKSKVSHYSGYGFNNYVCQWVLVVLVKITMKYDPVLAMTDSVPPNEKMRWNQIPVIMDLLDILCKTIKSKMVGHEVVSIIMRQVSQQRNNLLWVVKYIGERHPCGIVDKVIDCILSEFVPQQEFSKLQSCMLVLSNLGTHHARQLQSALYDKLKNAVDESSNTVTQHKFTNYQTLIYFTLLLASRNDLFDLSSAALSMVSRLICQFNPKQLEQFFLNQNFNENILRSYYHMTLNIMLNSQELEIGRVLEFLVQHSHWTATATKCATTCCTASFSHMCGSIVDTVCNKLLIQSHSSFIGESSVHRTMSLAVLHAVMQRIEFWTHKVVKDGSSVAAKLICSIILNDFITIGEDLLVAIVTNEPTSVQEAAGHKAALVLFYRILDECELVSSDVLDRVVVRSLCVAQAFKGPHQRALLATLYSLLVYEARMQSQRRRLARALSANVDLLLLVPVTGKSSPLVRLAVAILLNIDVISDERFSTPTSSPFRVNVDARFKAWPIFVSARVVRSVAVLYAMLVAALPRRGPSVVATLRPLADFLANFLRATDPRHNSAAVQIVLREYLRGSMIETNNRTVFKKALRPGWFGPALVHRSGPASSNEGQLHASARPGSTSAFSRVQEMHWQQLVLVLCHLHRSHDLGATTAHQAVHWVIRQALAPSYYLPVNPDVKVILKDLNSITTLWRRFNSVDIFWTLLTLLAHVAPDTLDSSSQTLKALMIACEHLWSTSDCPKRRLLRNVADSDIFVTDSNDEHVLARQRHYELVCSRSALFRATVALLECLSDRVPLAAELRAVLPYLSSAEVHTVLTHLSFNWTKRQTVIDNKGRPPAAPTATSRSDMDVGAEDGLPLVSEPSGLDEAQQTKNTFSWDTLLPAIVHSRIHFRSLYDQFYRLLSVPYDF